MALGGSPGPDVTMTPGMQAPHIRLFLTAMASPISSSLHSAQTAWLHFLSTTYSFSHLSTTYSLTSVQGLGVPPSSGHPPGAGNHKSYLEVRNWSW